MVARGTHPNSLANLALGPKFQPGHGNTTGARGPVITPAIRRFAGLTLPQLYALDGERLTVAELIAVRYLTQAMTVEQGDRARADVTDRLDGAVKDNTPSQLNQVFIREFYGNGQHIPLG